MGSPPAPHPEYVVTSADSGPGAGPGIPGAVVRDAVTGRVVDRVPGHPDMYLSVAGTGDNRLFFVGVGSGPVLAPPGGPAGRCRARGGRRIHAPDQRRREGRRPFPRTGRAAAGRAMAGGHRGRHQVGVSCPHGHGPPAPPGSAGSSPAGIHIVTVATGDRTVWRAGSDGFIQNLSFSADARMANSSPAW
jgi:hypothetical protein